MFGYVLLWLAFVPLVWGQPYPIPPTCYSKVLEMGKQITQTAKEVKTDHATWMCAVHLPYLYIDVHNACVMHTMSSYLSQLYGMRHQRCSYTRKVQELAGKINQLYNIMSRKCHGDLVFTYDNCAVLQRHLR